MSFDGWPTLYLALSVLAVWLMWRLFAGRTVLPARRFMRFFLVGMVGAGLASLVCQRIATIWMDVETVSWSVGPIIEEVLKAAPVLILVFVLRDARRLAVGDVVMAGVATGLGFEFFEGNFTALSSGDAPHWHEVVWPISYPFGIDGDFSYFVGHGVTAGLVALAAIAGFRIGGRLLGGALSLAALALGTFVHIMYNWKIVTSDSLFGELQSVSKSSAAVERVYDLTLQGRLVFVLLLIGLVAAVWIEGRRCAQVLSARSDLVLSDEWRRPLTAVEYVVAIQRIPAGRRIVTGTLAFFRERRALALSMLYERPSTDSDTGFAYGRGLEERLVHRLDELDVPSDGRWLPPRAIARPAMLRFVRRTATALTATVLMIVVFSIGLSALGDWVDRVYSTAVSILLLLIGVAFALRRLRRFLRQPRPDRDSADGSALATYHTQAMLLGCAALSAVAAVAALLSADAVLAGAFVTGTASTWVQAGGSIATVAGLGTVLASSTPDAPDPCQGLLDEMAGADDELASLEKEAAAANENAESLYTKAIADGLRPDYLVTLAAQPQLQTLPTAPIDDFWKTGEPFAASPLADAAAGRSSGPSASGAPGAGAAPAAAPPVGQADDDTILVMSDGVRLKVPLRIAPPRTFGTTRAPVPPARSAAARPPRQLVEELQSSSDPKATR